MQKTRKLLIVVLLTAVIGGIAVFADRYEPPLVDYQLAELILPGNIKISPWTDEKNNISYYFIPSYVDFEEIQLSTDGKQGIKIGNTVFNDGDRLFGFKADQEYIMFDKDNIGHNIEFLQSGETATIFVSTITGSMDAIYKSKEKKEVAKITVLDKGGNVDFTSSETKIKGRGNSTWDALKRPFSIFLNEPKSLLGMGTSSKWVLLANSYDDSEIRNAMVFDMARKVGLPGTSEYEYVNLYLNGEYNGLYMICQSVDTFTERTDVDKEGLFLFSAELAGRKGEMKYTLYAEDNKAFIDVELPDKLSAEEIEVAEEIITEIDTVIKNGGNNIGEVIDLDSWVKKYLIDESFENIDSGIISSYFYKSTKDVNSKVFAGPIWDYDLILGNERMLLYSEGNPEVLFAKQDYRSSEERILWYSELYSNPVFYNEMVKTFKEDFLPYLEWLIQNGIYKYSQKISLAKSADDIRWGKDSPYKYEKIVEFLSKRVDFLKSIWLDNEEYVKVTHYTPGENCAFYIAYILKGHTLADNPEIMAEFSESDIWYVEGTDEEYDFTLPVNEDIVLVKPFINVETGIKDKIKDFLSENNKFLEIGVSIGALVFAVLLLQLRKRLKKGVR